MDDRVRESERTDESETAGPVVPALTFDSLACGSTDDSLDSWRETVAPLFDVWVDTSQSASASDFCGHLHAYHLGAMVLAGVSSTPHGFRRTAATIARSGVDHYLVIWYRRGGCRGEANGVPLQAHAGDILLLDMSQPTHGVVDEQECVVLVVPRALLETWLPESGHVHGMVVRGDTAAGRILGDHLASMYRGAAELSSDHAPLILQATANLIAGCLGPGVAASDLATPNVRAASVLGIKCFVESNLGLRELKPDLVCQRFGLSRPTLFRMFERHGGFSRYIRDRRLQRCFQEIMSPAHAHRRISDIADSWCFNNEAAFSRAFRRVYEASPREVRQAAQGATAGRLPGLPRPGREPSLNAWLYGLSGF